MNLFFYPIVVLLGIVPALSAGAQDWKPVAGEMMTEWGKKVTADRVHEEYPRPQFRRKQWTNLNGLWDHAVVGKGMPRPESWDGKILVPFPPEAALSGVGRRVKPDETLWYRKTLHFDPPPGHRTLLHFGAVDYRASVVLNGEEVGTHQGGFTPFSFDVTSALRQGENELVVRVEDDQEGTQLHGKQSRNPRGIWYPTMTGIWQTVWYEHVPARAISSVTALPEIDGGKLEVRVGLTGQAVAGHKLRLTVSHGGVVQARAESYGNFSLVLADPKPWSPEHPDLYDLVVELVDQEERVIDSAESYTAFREISKQRDAGGTMRLHLNGKPLFLYGPLDQGWWPDGLLTPPSDEAVLADLRFIKDAGFNMVRKHVKVESARYYYHCDRLGLAVWQDQVSSNFNEPQPDGRRPTWKFLAGDPVDGIWPDEAHGQWVTEYKRMVDFLRRHPSILIWSPFNEAWGQHRSMEIGRMAVDYDKTRLVCHASGGNFWPVGDIVANHSYPVPSFPMKDARFVDFVKTVGEMGGYGLAVPGHVWRPDRAWGHGGLLFSMGELKTRYEFSLLALDALRKKGLSAAVYTQTSDVFTELNGLMTFDRVPKFEAAWLKQANEKVMKEVEPLEPAPPGEASEPGGH